MPPKRKATTSTFKMEQEEGGSSEASSSAPASSAFTPKMNGFKSSKRDSESGGPNCVIKWEIPNVSTLSDNGVNSPTHTVKGLPWYVRVRTESSERTNNVNQFSLYLYCDEKSASCVWYADVLADIRLLNSDPTKSECKEKFTYRFNYQQQNSGYASLIAFDKLTNVQEGFIRDNKVRVEVAITVMEVRGISDSVVRKIDYTQPRDYFTDATLTIQGKKLHISRLFLAMHSPVFDALFYRGFKESGQSNIDLGDVDYDDFYDLLEVMHPDGKEITGATCAKILKVADQFQIRDVIKRISRFLSEKSELQLTTRLKLADQYNLYEAQDACIQTLKTAEDFKNAKNQRDYIMLSEALKVIILEKQLKVPPVKAAT